MAEYETPDELTERMREQLAEARADGVDRHAVPSATRYDGPGAGKVAAALHGPAEAVASSPPSRVPPLLALIATLTLSTAQGVVAYPDALSGLPEGVLRAVLTVAQLVVVLAAIYRMGPAR